MRLIVLIVFLLLIGLFAALNPNVLSSIHTTNLGLATYQNFPAVLLLLLLTLTPMLIFYFWAGVTKLKAQADSAKLLRDIESLRVNLDSQEGTRFAQLQAHLDNKLAVLSDTNSKGEIQALRQRLDDMQQDMNLQLAQMDDYLKRKLG